MPYFSDRIGARKRLSIPPKAWTEIASIGSSILKRSTMFLDAMYPVPKNEKTNYMQWFQNKILRGFFISLPFLFNQQKTACKCCNIPNSSKKYIISYQLGNRSKMQPNKSHDWHKMKLQLMQPRLHLEKIENFKYV